MIPYRKIQGGYRLSFKKHLITAKCITAKHMNMNVNVRKIKPTTHSHKKLLALSAVIASHGPFFNESSKSFLI